MLSNELCKKLKEVGFKKEIRNGDYIWIQDSDNEWLWEMYDENWFEGTLSKCVRMPTLSELIEACGGGFETLSNGIGMFSSNWTAGRYDTYESEWLQPYGEGDIPEEAVANLYLELKKNGT